MADNMQELKEQKIWMLWRWETKPDGKRTKVSMSVSGGPCGTDDKWHSSWATYDEAERQLRGRTERSGKPGDRAEKADRCRKGKLREC